MIKKTDLVSHNVKVILRIVRLFITSISMSRIKIRTICDSKCSVCLCNCHHMKSSSAKMMNNKRMNYFPHILPRENPHMEFVVAALNSQMSQHLDDLFGVFQSRMLQQGCLRMLVFPTLPCPPT